MSAADAARALFRRPAAVGDPDDRRRWRSGALAGGGLALLVQTWMLTAGTWDLLRWQQTADFYDEQAHALLDGTLAMDPRVLGIESFSRGDEAYMYFGPVPALLRLPVAAVTDRLDGRLGAVSMLAALVVTLVVLVGIGWRLRARVLGELPVTRPEIAGAAGLMFTLLAGSSLLFASSRTWVYHEAIVWGVAWTLASYAALLAWFDGNGRRFVVWAAAAATAAMLTRPSVGGGAVAALGAVLASALVERWRAPADDDHAACDDHDACDGRDDGDGRRLLERLRMVPSGRPAPRVLLAAGVLVPVGAYAVVNWLKFRTLFSVPFDRQGFTLLSAQRRAMLEANGGSLFNWRFVPTNTISYARPDTVGVSTELPLLRFRPSSVRIGDPVYDLIDPTAGLPATMPLLVVLAVVGLVAARRHAIVALRPIVLGSLLGTLPVLGIGYLANRYQSDFLPLLAVPALAGAPMLTRWLRERSASVSRAGIAAAVVLGAFGVGANAALGYTYQRAVAPPATPDELASYLSAQLRFDRWVGDGRLPDVARGDELPTEADLGDVFIVGDCAGLYWSDGREGFDLTATPWKGVIRAEGDGGFAGTVRFDGASIGRRGTVELGAVVDADGTPTTIVRADIDRDVLTVVVETPDSTTVGPDQPYRPDAPLDLDIVADPRVGVFELRLDGRLAIFAGHRRGATFVPTVDSAVTITPEPIDLGLCRDLLPSAP